MEISLTQPEADVAHPAHPDLVFRFRKPDGFDVNQIQTILRRYERKKAIYGADNEPIMIERDGQKVVATESSFEMPTDESMRLYLPMVLDVRGLTDKATGEPIKFAKSNDAKKIAILRSLLPFSIELSPPRKVKVKLADGTFEEVEQNRLAIYDWITEQASNPETYGISSGKD